ncbi:MAG: dihydropteroate synthase [Alphaproteobacteria bacterium]
MNFNPKLVGILNITPDSFSDGGKYLNLHDAVSQAEQLITDGADIIDIGAESTRPNAIAISSKEEWNRLSNILPIIINLAKSHNIMTSIDTYHIESAQKAIDLGIDIVNDVSGANSLEMQKLVSLSNKKIIIMHNLGIPANPKFTVDPQIDIIKYIKDYAEKKILQLMALGVERKNIIFDPGIGFGKNTAQSFELIKNISQFHSLNVEILVGHSRKSFFNMFTSVDFKDRDIETFITSVYLAKNNVSYLRVHNVAANKRALNIANALSI